MKISVLPMLLFGNLFATVITILIRLHMQPGFQQRCVSVIAVIEFILALSVFAIWCNSDSNDV